MKKIFVITILLSFFIILISKEITIESNSGKPVFQTLSSDNNKSVIAFNLDNYTISQIKRGGIVYTKIDYNPIQGDQYETGKPFLPTISGFVAIPNNNIPHAKIISSEYEEIKNIVLYPQQKDEENKKEFTIDDNFYSLNIDFPSSIVYMGKPAILRDYRLSALKISPFQYNPAKKTLKIYKNIKIEIDYTKTANALNTKINHRKHSRFFEKIYKETIINYDFVKNRDEEYQQPSMLVIYANNTNLENLVFLFSEWKRQKGFLVTQVSTAQTGSSFNSIKNYIQDAYDNWENPPEYLVLVGDAYNNSGYFIPTQIYNGGAGDIAYTLLEGNDILGDMFVGRLSVSTESEMQTVLQKIFKYEKTPYLSNTNWYSKAVLIGDPSNSGESTIYTNLFIKQIIRDTNPNYSFYEAYSGNYTSTMSSAINSGVLYLNYRGWYGMSGWENSNTLALTNGYMLPMVVAITCGTGDFDYSTDAINEVFLTAGTPANPKGGIAAISTATVYTHTCFNNIVDAGIYQAIFKENITTPGAALTRAKYALYLAYPQNPASHVTEFSYWNNLMGDPSIELWTNQPQEMQLVYPENIPFGTEYITVSCYDTNGNPLKDVWITAYKNNNQIFATGFSNDEGKVLLNINALVNGEIKLTATKHNFIPQLQSIIVASQNQNLAMQQLNIDDSNGNNNGNINPGEQINLDISLKNYGTDTATGISATISSESELVNIINNTVSYPDIPPSQIATSNQPFIISFINNILDGEKVTFKIDISNGGQTHTDFFELDVKSSIFIIDDYVFVGDSNGFLDPGETDNMYIDLKNLGSITATNVMAELVSDNSDITILNSTAEFGDIPPNNSVSNIENQFEISASDNLIPGMVIPLQITISFSNDCQQVLYLNLQIGEQDITDPVGPDEFGHFIYDDEDISYLEVPTYDWIEIDPDSGGGGTILNLSDSGGMSDIEVVELPINFKFYGKSYSELTISTDGWISPGNHNQPAFMNWPIPGPLAPQPLIAVFWDDLKRQGNTSKIIYKHNNSNDTFIVEWKNMKQSSSGANETFQVILYDSGTYPTINLDSKLKFQYKDIENVDGGSYGGNHVTHGQYSTVGIQDENGILGLQYTYNNTYPVAAKHLQNNMALLVSGSNLSSDQTFLILESTDIENDDNNNGQADFGEQADLYLNLYNLGHQTATNVSVSISTEDEYVTILNNQSNYNDIHYSENQRNLQPFIVEISGSVPDGHVANIDMIVNSNEGNWQYEAHLILNSINLVVSGYGIANETNSNGILEPGEAANIIFYLDNNGGAPETNLDFNISTTDSYISFEQSNFFVSHIYGNSHFGIVYHISISSDVSNNQMIPLIFNISGDNQYSVTLPYYIRLGGSFEDFESGNFSSFNWEFPQNSWLISNTVYHSSNHSAQSPDIDDNQITTIQITVQLNSPSQVSFYRKVSCEDDGHNGYDRLEFWIDDSELDRWGGERNWQQFSYEVPEGTHTLSWIYRKDDMISEGQDCAWIDDIQLPDLSEQITEPQMMLSYQSVQLTMAPNQTLTDTIDITNIGASVLAYFAQVQNSFADFISLENVSSSLECGQTAHLLLNFNSQNLEEGDYTAQIYITDNRNSTLIPVTLTVQAVNTNQNQIPLVNKLYSSFPNPYFLQKNKSGVSIKFAIKSQSKVSLKIYNLKGQLVRTLLDKYLKAGEHMVIWDTKDNSGKRASTGLYLYRIKTNGFEKLNKMILIK